MVYKDYFGKEHRLHSKLFPKFAEVRSILEKNADDLRMSELWLFGSVARGDYDLESDIDFMVVVDDPNVRKASSIKVELLDVREDMYYPNVDVIVRTRRAMEDLDDFFAANVRRDHIVLWRRNRE